MNAQAKSKGASPLRRTASRASRLTAGGKTNQKSEAMSERSDDDPPAFESLHDEAGVDLTQIDMMLALTPAERLEWLFITASSLARLMPAEDTE